DAADLQIAGLLAMRAALSLDNARLFEAERDARRDVEVLQGVTTALAAAATPRDVGEAVLGTGLAPLGVAAGSVYQLDEQAGEVVLLATAGYAVGTVRPGRRRPLEPGTPGADVLARRAPVWFGDRGELAAAYPEVAAGSQPGEVGSLA